MLDPEQNFVAYIHTICRNAIFDTFKKAAYEETFKTKVRQFIEISETMQEDDDFYEAYKKVLAEAIAKLPPRRQAVFELCKLQGKTYEEVAQRFGISCSTVHDHIVKANQFIREYLLAYSLT
jgi:RNA polymerase sigma-70 factor (ECF subfamily)